MKVSQTVSGSSLTALLAVAGDANLPHLQCPHLPFQCGEAGCYFELPFIVNAGSGRASSVCVVVFVEVGEQFHPLCAKNSLDFQSRTAEQAKRFSPHYCLERSFFSSTHSTTTHTLLINDRSCL